MDNELQNPNFEPMEYVKKYYSNYSEDEIRNTINKLDTLIMKDQNQTKMLVKSNFNNFIRCKILIDDLKKENLSSTIKNSKMFEKSAEEYLKRFELHLRNAKIDKKESENEKEREKIRKKYQIIFELKKNLTETLDENNYKKFVEIYCKARNIKEKINDEYITELFNQSHLLKIRFLDKMAEIIENAESSIEEISLAFKYHFLIEGGDRNSIGNTLLVNIKYFLSKFINTGKLISNDIGIMNMYDTEKVPRYDLNVLDEIGMYLLKILKCVNTFYIEKQVIEIFFKNVLSIIYYGSEYKIILSKLKRFSKDITEITSNEISFHFIDGINKIEEKILRCIWKDSELIIVNFLYDRKTKYTKITDNDIQSTCKNFESLFKDSISTGIDLKKVKSIWIDSLNKMCDSDKSIYSKYNYSEFIENVYKLKKDFEKVKKIGEKYKIYIKKEDLEIDETKILNILIAKINFILSDSYLLMLSAKIIFEFPCAYPYIFKKCAKKFGNSNTIKYYIGHLIDNQGGGKSDIFDGQYKFLKEY